MFERLKKRARQACEAQAERRRREIAERLSAEAPPGIAVAAHGDSVAVTGHALKRRLALDPAVRVLFGGRR